MYNNSGNMNFNYQKARDLMVENQLRPNKIKEIDILDIFKQTPKENFVPKEYSSLTYSDMDILIKSNRGYLKNLHIAQLLKYAEIEKNHKILHLGAQTGYVSVLLSRICSEVYVVETDSENMLSLKKNINKMEIENIKIVNGSFREGYLSGAPYDRIIITAACSEIPLPLLDQLKENGLILAPVGDSSQSLVLLQKTSKGIIEIKKQSKYVFVPLIGKFGKNKKK